MNDARREPVDLDGVPETMLMPLWNRAANARGTEPFLNDPMSVGLVERIDYDFRGRFGKPSVTHAVRARYSDGLIRGFMARNRGATVISLGEGLDTQFWRTDDGTVTWLTIDVSSAIEVRRRLLPPHPRNTLIASSALDPAWLDDPALRSPVFICAAGLLMYFERAEAIELLRRIVERFERGEIFFDTIPPWFSRKTLRGWAVTRNYTAPPMPFGLALGDVPEFLAHVPDLEVLDVLTYAEPYPNRMRFFGLLSRIPAVKSTIAPGFVYARFGADRVAA